MRQCPKCLYKDPPYWRPALNNNPQGAVDVARFDELEMNESKLAAKVFAGRGSVICEGLYCYYYGKRAVYVHRVLKELYRQGGSSVFHIPHEKSRRYSEHKRSQQLEKFMT